MTRRSLLSALVALVLPKPAAPERYLIRLTGLEIPKGAKIVIYNLKQYATWQATCGGWEMYDVVRG